LPFKEEATARTINILFTILQLGDYSKVEEAVNTLFKEVRSTGVLVAGPMIQAQASAHLMNTDNFEASAGWLFCF
jgi:hypothetical protein